MQIFLEGKLQGVDDCLLAPATRDAHQVFSGRSHWISLLSETLPRALLAELGLAKILLGSSGGGRFLLVLPEETRAAAEEFLRAAAAEIAQRTGATLYYVETLPPKGGKAPILTLFRDGRMATTLLLWVGFHMAFVVSNLMGTWRNQVLSAGGLSLDQIASIMCFFGYICAQSISTRAQFSQHGIADGL